MCILYFVTLLIISAFDTYMYMYLIQKLCKNFFKNNHLFSSLYSYFAKLQDIQYSTKQFNIIVGGSDFF